MKASTKKLAAGGGVGFLLGGPVGAAAGAIGSLLFAKGIVSAAVIGLIAAKVVPTLIGGLSAGPDSMAGYVPAGTPTLAGLGAISPGYRSTRGSLVSCPAGCVPGGTMYLG